MSATIQATHHFIGDRDIEEAQQRAERAHQEAERCWAAVEDATRLATLAEDAAKYWASVAQRVALQRGFRRVLP